MSSSHGTLTTLAFRPASEFSSDDTILVGQHTWDELNHAASSAGIGRISISIVPRIDIPQLGPPTDESSLSSLVCWAKLGGKNEETTLPFEWGRRYGRIFGLALRSPGPLPTHSVSLVSLVVLSEVVIQAESLDSYATASSNVHVLQDWLCSGQRIIRQQSSYALGPDAFDLSSPSSPSGLSAGTSLRFKVVMTSPVLQGYADPSLTRFVILPPQREKTLINGHGHSTSGISTPTSDVMSAYGDIEIDESFLAGAMNTTFGSGTASVNMDEDAQPSRQPHRFSARPLPSIVHQTLDDHTVYIRTSDLSRLGILDADWVLLRPEHSFSWRAVRAQADDDVVEDPATLYASPILLHNICSRVSQREIRLELQPLPDTLRTRTLPTASAVTVARVASQISINRAYHPLVLHALKSSIDAGRRLVRQGDLLAVSVDLQQLQIFSSLTEDALINFSSDEISTSPKGGKEVVYFLVTNVDSQPQGNGLTRQQSNDLSVAFAVGELGCWIDAEETRVVQTGVEHTFIPNSLAYLGLAISQEVDADIRNNTVAYERIHNLVAAALVPRALSYGIPISVVLKGTRGVGKTTTIEVISRKLGMHAYKLNCYDLIGENDAKTEGMIRARFDQVASCSPCVLILQDIDAFTQTTQNTDPNNEPAAVNILKDLMHDMSGSWRLSGYPVLVFGTTSEAGRVPQALLACFKHEVEFQAPDERERAVILRSLLADKSIAPEVDVEDLARKTAALVAGDIAALVSRAGMKAVARAADNKQDFRSVALAGVAITGSDFEAALDDARSSYSQSIGAPKIPSVSWEDVGGLADVKADILDTIQLPLEHPELFSQDLKKRSGILLYGPPGTGKTLLAKAVATSFSLNFFSVKGPELLNMYIGESEANVRRVFQRARDARPCVVFFDELDSVAPKRGAHGDSGGVMDRIVSQLLAELDGISSGSGGDVFVIGATNRPDLLDPALLRPGRFDRMLYLGVSSTNSAQLKIVEALTRKFRLAPELDLMAVVEKCPFNFTGADFYALCTDALLKAMTRKAEEVDVKIALLNNGTISEEHPVPITPQYFLSEMATPDDVLVTVSQADFDDALRELTPSVSQAEMEHYARIQRRFSHKGDMLSENRV